MKKVIIAHGWDGFPEEGWFPWLKEELGSRKFKVIVPQLPNPEEPRISTWVPALQKASGKIDKDTYFVGHSMGVQAIVRLLESLPENVKIGGAIFVAGFFKHITNLEQEAEVIDVDREWATTPIDFEKVSQHLPKSIAIFSDNDPYVSLENQEEFRDKLSSEIIIEPNKGHFSGPSDGVTELPIVLESLLKISQ